MPTPPEHPVRETPEAARAYADYEALTDRSLPKLADWYRMRPEPIPPAKHTFAPSLTTLKRWSRQHAWQRRLAEYEQDQLERRRVKRQGEQDKADDEQILIGRTQVLRAVAEIERQIKAGEMTPGAAVRLLEVGTHIWRVAQGSATERSELVGQDGGPIQVGGGIGFYQVELPAKQPIVLPPGSALAPVPTNGANAPDSDAMAGGLVPIALPAKKSLPKEGPADDA